MTLLATSLQLDKRSEEEVARLRSDVAEQLSCVVGKPWVEAEPAVLDTYVWQFASEMLTGGDKWMPRPLAVAMPQTTEEVAEIVKLANRMHIQYKALSTGFGFWNAPTAPDSVVLIDLRRMDRILKIDPDNMYAVVEPYVSGNQLQSDAMKLGLNTHVAGCGGQCSVLASATSMMGQGWDGVSTSFSGRNLLGVEWVTPDGEIVQVGSFDTSGAYFSGDGPGPSLRGAFRGFGGAFGGLGVFTKAAVKLYPFPGATGVKSEGISPVYLTEIPPHHFAALVLVNDWDDMAELGYRLGESEICDYLGRNAPSLLSGSLTVDNQEMQKLYKVPLFHEMYYALVLVILAENKEELDYRKRVLKRIVRSLNGGMIMSGLGLQSAFWMLRLIMTLRRRLGTLAILRSIPSFIGLQVRNARRHGLKRGLGLMSSIMYQALVRHNLNMRGSFRFSGSFRTSMGALVTWDNAIHGAKVGAEIKKKYIKRGILFDDGADNAWGGLYEDGAYAHLEELACYDPTDNHCQEHMLDYMVETNIACIDHKCGDSLNAIGPAMHHIYSEPCSGYDRWQQALKKSLDPANASDASYYTDPDFAAKMPERLKTVLARVQADPERVKRLG